MKRVYQTRRHDFSRIRERESGLLCSLVYFLRFFFICRNKGVERRTATIQIHSFLLFKKKQWLYITMKIFQIQISIFFGAFEVPEWKVWYLKIYVAAFRNFAYMYHKRKKEFFLLEINKEYSLWFSSMTGNTFFVYFIFYYDLDICKYATSHVLQINL